MNDPTILAIFPLFCVRTSLRSVRDKRARVKATHANPVIFSHTTGEISCGGSPIVASVGVKHWTGFAGIQFTGCWVDHNSRQVHSA